MAGPGPVGSLESCQAAIPQAKTAGICKSGPSSASEFRAIGRWVTAPHTGVGKKSHTGLLSGWQRAGWKSTPQRGEESPSSPRAALGLTQKSSSAGHATVKSTFSHF